MNRLPLAGLLVVTLFVASGATCHRQVNGVDPLAPAAFVTAPTLDDLIYAVNSNTDRVQQLHSDNASLSIPGIPALRTSLSLERPSRFRLRSKLLSPELDLGSNDELFWFWAKSAPEPVVYYASHQEYATSPVRGLFPVDPRWLVEALGLVHLEPGAVHEGPVPQGSGRVALRSRINSAADGLTRVLVIDDRYGWILEQHLLNSDGQVLATARTSNHRFYPVAAVSLPHRIEIEMPAAQMNLRIDVSEFQVNQLYGDPTQLWSMPPFPGYTPVNIATPQALAPATPFSAPTGYPTYETEQQRAAMRPTYRGF